MIIGHEAARSALEGELPPVTLLLGPKSVGKTTLARHLAAHHSPGGGPFLRYFERLSAGLAREIVQTAPILRRSPDICIIDLDNSTEAAQNILLKVLEEPPAHSRFILIASRVPLVTILSRARVYRLGLLTETQVALVLRQCGFSSPEAAQAAVRSRGQVAPAIEAAGDREASRITSVVAAAVRAASEGGGTAVDMALRNWTPEHTKVLERWAMEKANGRWVYFTAEFAPRATQRGALNMLYVLGTYDARTAPAVALDVLKEPK